MDRVALVTGASARIGLAIVTRLAESGHAVVLHASPRSISTATDVARRLSADGMRACAIAADLADASACAPLIGEAAAAFGPLTMLVNNAALFEPDGALAPDLAVWERQFAVNLRAPVLLAAAFVAQARPDTDASIVNLVDQRVLHPTAQHFSYTLTKAALWTATQTAAQAFAPQSVRVNAVAPGPVLPNALEGDIGFRREVETLPLRRAVHPGDVADAVLYLAHARSVTGQMIAVDGGQHLTG